MDGLSRLPSELRALIWNFCLPGPQHILLDQPRASPAVFHICRESRAEAERSYTRITLDHGPYATHSQQRPGDAVWINFSKDTICLEPRDLLPTNPNPGQETPTPHPIFHHAQSLAFEFSAPQNFIQLLDILTPIHASRHSLPNLKEVILYSPPKKWFEDANTGRVQERHPPLADPGAAARILLRLLHMLFGGHAWLDSGAGIPPPLRWAFVCDGGGGAGKVFTEGKRGGRREYVFRCAVTGRFEVQGLGWEELGRLGRVEGREPRVHGVVGAYEGCPEHGGTEVGAGGEVL